ncbi:LOW QUALITY PROTEIN: collagen alpha-1(VI) chain-like [Gastrophryne carolinensis]
MAAQGYGGAGLCAEFGWAREADWRRVVPALWERKQAIVCCTQVIGIGVGDLLKRPPQMKVLQDITCAGTRNEGMHVVVNEFYELLEDSIVHNVTESICKGSKCPDFTCHVEFDEPTDFVFLMDGSSSVGRDNFDKVKEFIKLTINKILSKELNVNNMLRLSVIQYSHNAQRLEVPFTNIKEDALSRLSKVTYMNEGTDLPDALRFVTKHLKCDARPNVKSQIFIFSDGRSSGNAQHQIAAQAAEAINPKTELFAITVGTFHELGISQLVSGKKENFNFNKIEDKIFRVSEYNDLLKRVTVQSLLKKITF